MSEVKKVPIGDIKIREDLYPRTTVDRNTVYQYLDNIASILYKAPIVINQDNILIDGRHRLEAAKLSDRMVVPVVVTETDGDGDVWDLCVELNNAHGKPMTTNEKRDYVLERYVDLVTPMTVTKGHKLVVARLASKASCREKTVYDWLSPACKEMRRQRDGLVLSDRAKGVPVAKIMAKFNISDNTYNRIAKEHVERERKQRRERDWQIGSDARAGVIQQEIAQKHGVSQQRVSQITNDRHFSADGKMAVIGNNADEVANTDFKVRDSPEDHDADSEAAMQQEPPKPPIDITPSVAKAPETEAVTLTMEHAESHDVPATQDEDKEQVAQGVRGKSKTKTLPVQVVSVDTCDTPRRDLDKLHAVFTFLMSDEDLKKKWEKSGKSPRDFVTSWSQSMPSGDLPIQQLLMTNNNCEKSIPTHTRRSPLRYPGGKSRAVRVLQKYLPHGLKRLVSPFLGGGSFELSCAADGIKVHAADAFGLLVNFWKHTKASPGALAEKVEKSYYPIDRGFFYRLQKEVATIPNDIERAAVFYTLNRASFSGITLSGGFSTGHDCFTQRALQQLRDFCAPNLEVVQAGFEETLSDHPDDFLYCDPPYANCEGLYGVRGDLHKAFDHEGLSKLLLKRTGGWMLCYNDDREIIRLYDVDGINIVRPEWSYCMSNRKSTDITR